MMRGDSVPKPEISLDAGPLIVPTRKRSRMVAANIVDPTDGTIQYHIVSTKFLNIMVASIVTLLLCGLVVLALVIYLKTSIDDNSQHIEKLQQEANADAGDTQESGPER